MNPKPLIALTQGDPAGIGPELCLKALKNARALECCRPLIIGDLTVLEQVSARLGLPLPATVIPVARALGSSALGAIESGLVDCGVYHDTVQPGAPTKRAGEASYEYIRLAIEGALAGVFAAITTAPITKLTMNMAGIADPGHTEILARLTQTRDFAMMLYSPRIAVSFVTCHQALRTVPDSLTIERIRLVTRLTGETLRAVRGRSPRLAVLGLNPHAGESGMFGAEEQDIIAPAIALARQDGWDAEGPIPPDAAFMPHALERYDGYVTMYHDQGGIPFKMISMHDGVNVTMGLPIIRTSVDHGTAYDIAWQGTASESSLIAALELAAALARQKKTPGAAS